MTQWLLTIGVVHHRNKSDYWWFVGVLFAELHGEFESAVFKWCVFGAAYMPCLAMEKKKGRKKVIKMYCMLLDRAADVNYRVVLQWWSDSWIPDSALSQGKRVWYSADGSCELKQTLEMVGSGERCFEV